MPNNPTEQNVQDSIENTGGIPEITVEMEVFGMTQTPVDKTLTIPDMAADAKAVGDAIADVGSDVADVAADVVAIMQWTGEDIPLNTDASAPTIAEAIAGMFANLYPVGSVYVTAAETLPAVIAATGTWVEIAVPLTWGDIRTGSRSYVQPGEGFTPGNLHSWLRTE